MRFDSTSQPLHNGVAKPTCQRWHRGCPQPGCLSSSVALLLPKLKRDRHQRDPWVTRDTQSPKLKAVFYTKHCTLPCPGIEPWTPACQESFEKRRRSWFIVDSFSNSVCDWPLQRAFRRQLMWKRISLFTANDTRSLVYWWNDNPLGIQFVRRCFIYAYTLVFVSSPMWTTPKVCEPVQS